MLKLLVAVDGSVNALRAVAHVRHLAARGVGVHVVLCNVQAPVMSGEVGLIAPMEVAELQRAEAAASTLSAAAGALGEAVAAHEAHTASGDPAEEIVRAAAAHRCDGIVMGWRGRGAAASLVLGSVSSRIVATAPVPVTLVQ